LARLNFICSVFAGCAILRWVVHGLSGFSWKSLDSILYFFVVLNPFMCFVGAIHCDLQQGSTPQAGAMMQINKLSEIPEKASQGR
jgi:hypothetical protein